MNTITILIINMIIDVLMKTMDVGMTMIDNAGTMI
jgi:hypothetical protein